MKGRGVSIENLDSTKVAVVKGGLVGVWRCALRVLATILGTCITHSAIAAFLTRLSLVVGAGSSTEERSTLTRDYRQHVGRRKVGDWAELSETVAGVCRSHRIE
jgi:hypothetical protein